MSRPFSTFYPNLGNSDKWITYGKYVENFHTCFFIMILSSVKIQHRNPAKLFMLLFNFTGVCLKIQTRSRSFIKSSSDITGTPSSLAFLFLEELDAVLLLIR